MDEYESPGEFLLRRLNAREPSIASMLKHRDSVARLLDLLPTIATVDKVASDISTHEMWEDTGRYFLIEGRLHEAIAVFWALYQQILAAQAHVAKWIHKGMPLVWIAECYGRLGFPAHAKRYLMLTLCEDALREHGSVSPDTTGIYFRLVWGSGLSHSELNRYAALFYALAREYVEPSLFPEALLQRVDDNWMTEYPAAIEAAHYRINPRYVRFLLNRLGRSRGESLEELAEYLMSCMPGCRTKRRLRSRSTDYDLVCSIEGFEVDYRSELGRYFVCECKDWSEPANFSAFAKFCRVLDSTKARFGILFSKEGISGAGESVFADREQLKVFQDRGIVIVVVSGKDLEQIAAGENMINLLRRRYEAVRLDARDIM